MTFGILLFKLYTKKRKEGENTLIQGSRKETYKENIGKDEMSLIENTSIFQPSTNVKKEY